MAMGKKLLTALLLVALLSSMLGISAFAQNSTATTGTADSTAGEVSEVGDRGDAYQDYMAAHKDAAYPKQEIVLSPEDHIVLDENFIENGEKLPVGTIKDEGTKVVLSNEEKTIAWKVKVDKAGFYNLKINYYTASKFQIESDSEIIEVKSNGSDISRAIYLDGKLPYYDARQINFTRYWANETPVQTDPKTNNQLRPFQIEKAGWQEGIVRDYLGYHSEPLYFYLEEGEHVIAFTPISENFAIKNVTFYQYEKPLSYQELLAQYNANGYQKVANNENTFIKIQAEDPSDKSDPTLYALSDRSTPSMEPYHTSKIRLNSIGGEKWQDIGSWMEWTFTVKEAGLYKIALKAKQNVLGGTNAHRRFMIDGKEVCQETNDLMFGYSTGYVMYTVGDDKNPDTEDMMFYFEPGEHTIRMEVTLGSLSSLLQRTEDCLTELNTAYRQILMLTGATPDINKDYQFDTVAKKAIEIFRTQNENLKQIAEEVKAAYNGKENEQSGVLKKLILILDEIERRRDTLKERFTDLKDNIAALGTWINTMRQQPLQMDYIIICSPDYELPAGDAGFFECLLHELTSFIASFTEDYDTIGSVTVEDIEPVDVWVETGAGNAGSRDNANVLKQIIDSKFTHDYNIPINLKLVAAGALLPATLAGNGPDVCLTRGSSDPVNYALRGAVINLNQFQNEDPESEFDIDKVLTQFDESALTPLRFRTGIYGLPETQDFNMLYYRTDVLTELGINPETDLETWDDIYRILPILQNKSMNFGMPVPVLGVIGASFGIYATLLYQRGGTFYEMNDEYNVLNADGELITPDGLTGRLDSDEALDAFKMWTDLFTVKRLPNSYDFANRFRSGEIPVAIAGYSAYNTLSVFAPEINGLWEFTSVPGTVRTDENGQTYVDHTTAGGVTACIMMSTCKNPENAWKFMAWWTGTEAQALFGREIESLLGSAARYQTANKAAIDQLPWDRKSREAIKEQWKNVKGVPEVPGSYYMGRNVEFAWKEVINTNSDPNLVLLEYSKLVNDEIARKRAEFQEKLDNKDLW